MFLEDPPCPSEAAVVSVVAVVVDGHYEERAAVGVG